MRLFSLPLLMLSAQAVAAQQDACLSGWLDKEDAAFAADCADLAFDGSLADRERLAWMIFARVNRLMADPGRGMSGSGEVPQWMAWPTDPDTFGTRQRFDFGDMQVRGQMEPSAEKKDLAAGQVATADPDGANEEVTRNRIAYDYLLDSGLTTKADVHAFFENNAYVDMPVGSVELKASWLQVTDGSPAPQGALTFEFDGGRYWWRGLHLMVKMRSISTPDDPYAVFYSEDPSWFWSTFEFDANPGVAHVRETLITQRAPLDRAEIAAILDQAGLGGFGLDGYGPNGTQIRFTVDGAGAEPVILGHTDMEDFAGHPNTALPRYWTSFEASCHACHATASYDVDSRAFFPFSVPTGALHAGYNMTDKAGTVQYLGQGYRPLDFMWPIAFQTR